MLLTMRLLTIKCEISVMYTHPKQCDKDSLHQTLVIFLSPVLAKNPAKPVNGELPPATPLDIQSGSSSFTLTSSPVPLNNFPSSPSHPVLSVNLHCSLLDSELNVSHGCSEEARGLQQMKALRLLGHRPC